MSTFSILNCYKSQFHGSRALLARIYVAKNTFDSLGAIETREIPSVRKIVPEWFESVTDVILRRIQGVKLSLY